MFRDVILSKKIKLNNILNRDLYVFKNKEVDGCTLHTHTHSGFIHIAFLPNPVNKKKNILHADHAFVDLDACVPKFVCNRIADR